MVCRSVVISQVQRTALVCFLLPFDSVPMVANTFHLLQRDDLVKAVIVIG